MAEYETIIEFALKNGAFKATCVNTDKIELDTSFYKLCEANACGMFGKCYMCPPDVGEIQSLMDSLSQYKTTVVFQTIEKLEDSYDVEGMKRARNNHMALCHGIKRRFSKENLYLGTGGCGVCKKCAKQQALPCRAPDKAMSSLEAYGINVSHLSSICGMKYINGKNTVTYFGAVFIK